MPRHVPFQSGWIPDLAIWLENHWRGEYLHEKRCRRWGTTPQQLRRFLQGEGQLFADTLYRIAKDTGIPMERLVLQRKEIEIVPPGPERTLPKGDIPPEEFLTVRIEVQPSMQSVYIEGDFRSDGLYVRTRESVLLSGTTDITLGTGLRITNTKEVMARFEPIPEFPYNDWLLGTTQLLNQEVMINLYPKRRQNREIKRGQRVAKLRFGRAAPLKFLVHNAKEHRE